MSERIKALKCADIGSTILFSCADGIVRDLEGNVWQAEFYRGNL